MLRSISRAAWTLAAAGTVVLTGCGGGGQATSAGALPAPTSVAPVTSTTVAPATTIASTSTTSRLCPDVALSSSSAYDSATEIKVVGLSCADAAALIAKVGPQVSPAGGPPRLESDGYVCLAAGARGTDHGPPSAMFECTSGAMKVSFVRN